MTLHACPNCSGYIDDPGKWVFGRPQLMTGRNSRRIFLMGCCAFSNRLSGNFATEEEAAQEWTEYRVKASAGDARLEANLARLDAVEGRFSAPLVAASADTVAVPEPPSGDYQQATLL